MEPSNRSQQGPSRAPLERRCGGPVFDSPTVRPGPRTCSSAPAPGAHHPPHDRTPAAPQAPSLRQNLPRAVDAPTTRAPQNPRRGGGPQPARSPAPEPTATGNTQSRGAEIVASSTPPRFLTWTPAGAPLIRETAVGTSLTARPTTTRAPRLRR